jgi:hypothetical protein
VNPSKELVQVGQPGTTGRELGAVDSCTNGPGLLVGLLDHNTSLRGPAVLNDDGHVDRDAQRGRMPPHPN